VRSSGAPPDPRAGPLGKGLNAGPCVWEEDGIVFFLVFSGKVRFSKRVMLILNKKTAFCVSKTIDFSIYKSRIWSNFL
jgi:hypothetical protein